MALIENNQGGIEIQSEKIGVIIGGKLLKEIKDGKSSALFLSILLAVVVDFSDFFLIGQIPVVGTIIKLIATTALTFILWDVGGFIKWKVRFLLWAGTLLELIPIVATLPIYTLSILWAYFKIKKRAGEAEIELNNITTAINNPIPEPDWDSLINQSPKRTIRPNGIPYA